MNSYAALFVCALALGACSSEPDPEEPDPAPAWALRPAIEEVPQHESEAPRAEPLPPPRDPTAVAATDHGLVAFDPQGGAIVAAADTLYQVTDLAYDPWRDRWLAAEHDDDSMTRVSVWRFVRRAPFGGRLQLERTIETGGYCRVTAAATSTVIFEHDGMQQRWMVWEAHGRPHASSLQAPMPAGVVVRSDAPASRLLSLSIADDGSGPRATMHRVRVQGGQAGPVIETALPDWSGTLDRLRAADAGSGRIAVVQLRDGTLRIGLIDDHGNVFRNPIQVELREARAVEDLVVDAARAIAFVAVSSPDRLLTIDLQHGALLDQQGSTPLPPSVAPWFSRLMAYDGQRGRLIVAGKGELGAWDLTGTRRLERVAGFAVAGARWPVALSASRSGPRP